MTAPAVPYVPRCGDTVRHRPTGDLLEVAYALGNDLAWFGWPDGLARLSDCEVVTRCTDEQHAAAVSMWLDRDGKPHGESGCSRAAMVRYLYRPEEERRLVREHLNGDCRAIAGRIAAYDADLAQRVEAFGKEGGAGA